MNNTEFSVTKPTFSAVYQAEEELRVFIEKLIEENRPLTPDERKHYYNLLASSTLGLGVGRDFRIFIDTIFRFGTVESTGRWLGQQTENMICIPGDMGNQPSNKIPIGVFWSKLLDELFHIFPLALDRAISMSKEDTEMHRSQVRGAKVGRKI